MAYKALEARTPSERMTALVLDIAELEAQLGKYGKISDEVLAAAIAERGSNERSVYISQNRREQPMDLPEPEIPPTAPAAQAPSQGQAKPQDPQPSSPPSSSPPQPTETKPAQPEAKKTSAKDSEANPAAPASSPPDPRAKEIRDKRVRGAYARRKHKRGGERCVQEILRQKGKEQIEDLSDVDLKVLLDALDKLAEADGSAGGAWR
jgi:type IV secretory pathway VirB10-like protein